MTKSSYLSTLNVILKFASFYMVGEALYHFSGVRLTGVRELWGSAELYMIEYFMYLWASAAGFFAVLLWFLSRDIQKNAFLLKLLAGFSVFHGVVIAWLARLDLVSLLPAPSLYLWLPHFRFFLVWEVLALWGFAGFVWWGNKRKFL